MTPTTAHVPSVEELRESLAAIGQEHLLTFYDELTDPRRAELVHRIASLDLEGVPTLLQRAEEDAAASLSEAAFEPAPYYPLDPESPMRPWDRSRSRAAGEALIRGGKVAAFTVAGGQGSRLGYDGPKGCFPGGAVTRKPLFQMLAEQIFAAQRRYDAEIHWCVMTSPLNHEETVAFFREHDFFGLDPDLVTHFKQGVLPSFDDESGKILLAEKDEPATNPDGHGGSLKALYTSGAVDMLQDRGVEHLSYVQIDNPLVNVLDPVFIGLHAEAPDSSAEMSSKMIAKTDPTEKVGVFCLVGGAVRVIEYSDLPEELAHRRNEDGSLAFNAGSPAIHVIGIDFIRRINESDRGFSLPLHRAHKKVPHIDLKSGQRVEPDAPNAFKLETFVFDAIPQCERSIILETDRMEFAPIKNADGADSPASSRALQTERAARWLEAAGVDVPRTPDGEPDCTLEISPLTALSPDDLRNADLPERIKPGASIAF